MRRMWFVVTILVGVATVCAGSEPPSIDEVAGDRMRVLHIDDDWRVFSIVVASGDVLADHATGPRAIVTLSDVEIQGLEESAAPMRVPAGVAMWLENTVSKGFRNLADGDMHYLVIEARNRGRTVEPVDGSCPSGSPVLANSALTVCRLDVGESQVLPVLHLEQAAWLSSEMPVLATSDGLFTELPPGEHTLRTSGGPVMLVIPNAG
jgi:hypothetical protein